MKLLLFFFVFSSFLINAQNFETLFVKGTVEQNIHNVWKKIEIGTKLTSSSFRMAEGAYIIVINTKEEARKISSTSFSKKDIEGAFIEPGSLTSNYFAYLYKELVKEKKKEKNTGVGAVSRGDFEVYPRNNSVELDTNAFLTCSELPKEIYYLYICNDKYEILIDTVLFYNSFEISSNISQKEVVYWTIQPQSIEITKNYIKRFFREISFVSELDAETKKVLLEIKNLEDEGEQYYFTYLLFEYGGYYSLADKYLLLFESTK